MSFDSISDDGGASNDDQSMADAFGRTDRRSVLKGAAALGLLSVTGTAAQSTVGAIDEEEVETVTGTGGMVSTSNDRASEIGARVLESGGNAVDAAAAVQFALNVVEPHASGVGGGGFMLIYVAEEDTVYAVNSRERAPMGAEPDMFLDDGEPIPFDERHTHGNAVGVPGTLRGIDVATRRFGTRSIRELVCHAIPLADGRETVEVDAVLAEAIDGALDKFSPAAREVFAPGGEPLAEGDELVQEDLAGTLRLIRDRGSEALYRGEIGEAIAETVQEAGGSMTVDDLGRYNVTVDHPTRFEYGDLSVASMSPPSSGGLTMGYILGLLEPFDLAALEPGSAEYYHHLLEAFRIAFADRGEYIGDDEFVDVPAQGLLDEDYLDERRALIDPDAANSGIEAGDPWAHQPGTPYRVSAGGSADGSVAGEVRDANTTHFVTADAEGNVVSYTSTVEQFFGTGLVVPGYGVVLNNELTDFDAEPGGANEVQPWKRPMSSMSPTIAFRDGEPYLATGTPGGPTIITTIVQQLLLAEEYGRDLPGILAEPRIYSASYPDILWEEDVSEEALAGLRDRGHEPDDEPFELGDVQALVVEDDAYVGAADPRRGGRAIGVSRE